MTALSHLLIKASKTPEQLTPDDFTELRRVCHEYPASTIAAALLLKYDDAHLSDNERQELRCRVALMSGDRHALISMIDPSGMDFAHFYPSENTHTTPTTENAIDTFLQTYGHQSPEEDALLERMIFNPVPDYAETLAREEVPAFPTNTPKGSQDALIDTFLAANPVKTPKESPSVTPPVPPTTPTPPTPPESLAIPTPSENSLLSESLAKIFIKQGRYERAYEIISNLSLNYPKKSVYFADQLRFLRKLMIIQQHAAKNNSNKLE